MCAYVYMCMYNEYYMATKMGLFQDCKVANQLLQFTNQQNQQGKKLESSQLLQKHVIKNLVMWE